VKLEHLSKELQKSSHCNCKPIFYQFIITQEMIKEKFPIVTTLTAIEKPSLTYEEVNAIQYSAGYIPRALQKKLKNSGHKLKEELILCLLELTWNSSHTLQQMHALLLCLQQNILDVSLHGGYYNCTGHNV